MTFARAEVMHEAAGTSLYGPDLSEWPSLIVDAFIAIQGEISKVEKRTKITPVR